MLKRVADRPRHRWRSPKRKRMTLCIAAECDAHTDCPKVVLCSDCERTAEAVGRSETEDKVGLIRRGWPVLVAGELDQSDDLVRVYSEYFNRPSVAVNESNILVHFRRPAAIQKRRLVDEYLLQSYAFDYKYLRRNANTLPEAFVTQQMDAIARIRLKGALIIAGFVNETYFDTGTTDPTPFLIVVDETSDANGTRDEVVKQSQYAAIGGGAQAALSTLYRRKQSATDSLTRTLYVLYEANKLSEKIPGVGEEFVNLDVLYPNGELRRLSDDGYKKMIELYSKFGPRNMDDLKKDWFVLEDKFFENPTGSKPLPPDSSQSRKP
jgi:hypothetical protein